MYDILFNKVYSCGSDVEDAMLEQNLCRKNIDIIYIFKVGPIYVCDN